MVLSLLNSLGSFNVTLFTSLRALTKVLWDRKGSSANERQQKPGQLFAIARAQLFGDLRLHRPDGGHSGRVSLDAERREHRAHGAPILRTAAALHEPL